MSSPLPGAPVRSPHTRGEPDSPRSARVLDGVLGLIGGVMILLAVGVLLWGGEPDGGAAAETGTAPPITLIEPAGNVIAAGPVPVVFEVPVRLRQGPSGWHAESLHLHARVDEIEIMPAADEIQPLGGDRYRWMLSLPPGQHTLRLSWSDPNHAPLPDGASAARTVTVSQTAAPPAGNP